MVATGAAVCHVKLVSRFQYAYMDERTPIVHSGFNAQLGREVVSVDLSCAFWRTTLDEFRLSQLLLREESRPAQRGPSAFELDRRAVSELAAVRQILAHTPDRLPDAEQLVYAYRVLRRLVALTSRHNDEYSVHLARGIVPLNLNPFSVDAIVDAANKLKELKYYKDVLPHLETAGRRGRPIATYLTLRNDIEIFQAALVAAAIRRLWPDSFVILDASDGNEQFDFAEWVPVMRHHRDRLSPFFDYFLPRQDYKLTLRALLNQLVENRGTGIPVPTLNVVPLSSRSALSVSTDETTLEALVNWRQPVHETFEDAIDQAFLSYLESQPIHRVGGQRTLVARLSSSRCHWSACDFCTINSQHLLTRGVKSPDDRFRRQMNALLDTLRERQVESLILLDEAVHPQVLIAFAHAILSRGLNVVYRARARFTDDFSYDTCRLLYDSGCRYLGCGLEAASPRVNRLVHKHSGDPLDYAGILANMENAGIRPHIYAILGFPTESADEIRLTRDFLVDAIERSRYVTVSPNLFHLMRGSVMAQHPERYGISGTQADGDFSLVLGFDEPQRNANSVIANEASQAVHKAQFFPAFDTPDNAEAFWHFIDQSSVFYVQKVLHARNPYRELSGRRTATITPHDCDVLSRSRYCWMTSERNGKVTLCDWVTGQFADLPEFILRVIEDWNDRCPLEENVRSVPPEKATEVRLIVTALTRAGFFVRAAANEQENSQPDSNGGRPQHAVSVTSVAV